MLWPSECLLPRSPNVDEMGVSLCPNLFDQRRKGFSKILVIAHAKTVAFHVYALSKVCWLVVQANEGVGVFSFQQPWDLCVTLFPKELFYSFPGKAVDALGD